MAIPAHMTAEGTDQGKIDGSCDLKGREDTILVQQFDHEVYIPSDPQSGLPTGIAVHKRLTICKYFDKASPKLYKALARGERLKTVEIKWYRINPGGKQ
jgi:type VI secretion system secreted protein Hcp